MKKVTLTVVVADIDDAKHLARDMEKSSLAQEGVYTLTCGDIQDLTSDEKELVESEIEHL